MQDLAQCPHRELIPPEGFLCFDPWLDEYAKPPPEVVRRWCSGDFRSCPIYLSYQDRLHPGIRLYFAA